MKTNSYCSNSI